MTYLTLEMIKKHLNLDDDFTDDDDYLKILGDVAETVIERHIDTPFEVILFKNMGEFPTPLKQACLLLVGTYYENRENISYTNTNEIPYSVSYLISLYQNYGENNLDQLNFYRILHKLAKKTNENTENINELSQRDVEGGTGIDIESSGSTKYINIDGIDQGEY